MSSNICKSKRNACSIYFLYSRHDYIFSIHAKSDDVSSQIRDQGTHGAAQLCRDDIDTARRETTASDARSRAMCALGRRIDDYSVIVCAADLRRLEIG